MNHSWSHLCLVASPVYPTLEVDQFCLQIVLVFLPRYSIDSDRRSLL